MKLSTPVIAAAVVATALSVGITYASRVSSQPRTVDVALYTPIGVVQTPNGAHTVAWLLDTTNRRVVLCTQRLNELNSSKIDCRAGELPGL
jgi:hypothetical protein